MVPIFLFIFLYQTLMVKNTYSTTQLLFGEYIALPLHWSILANSMTRTEDRWHKIGIATATSLGIAREFNCTKTYCTFEQLYWRYMNINSNWDFEGECFPVSSSVWGNMLVPAPGSLDRMAFDWSLKLWWTIWSLGPNTISDDILLAPLKLLNKTSNVLVRVNFLAIPRYLVTVTCTLRLLYLCVTEVNNTSMKHTFAMVIIIKMVHNSSDVGLLVGVTGV